MKLGTRAAPARLARLNPLRGRGLSFPYRAPSTPAAVERLPAERRTGMDFGTAWARSAPAKVLRLALLEAVVTPAVKLLADPERDGLDRLRDLRDEDPAPAVIFAANHHSHLDAPLVLSSVPEPWRYKMFAAAASDYFFKNRVIGTASALALNAIPFERSRVGRRSADAAADLLTEGWSMLIFPEGGRSPDGWGRPFLGGASYLALRCGVPVVPVHLEGTGRILRKGRSRPRRSSTRVTFGSPLHPGPGESARRFALRIERAVTALGDEAATDWYTARRRAHAGTSPSLVGPQGDTWRRAWALGDRGPKQRRIKRSWPDLG